MRYNAALHSIEMCHQTERSIVSFKITRIMRTYIMHHNHVVVNCTALQLKA